ncbi:MAG: leucine-rich repeat domain-containing protein [Clostridia bacterium]|nr:leucine-rich repeat domain-containing protein [Clostridia bacterium]
MNASMFIDAVGLVDADLIEEYVRKDNSLRSSKPRRGRRYLVALAAAVVSIMLIFALLVTTLPLLYVFNHDKVDNPFVGAIDRVIFPLDAEDSEIKREDLMLDWTQWPMTEQIFNALGAGSENSVIDHMMSDQQGLVGEAIQNLGKLLERLYEYYLKHKDSIQPLPDEETSESESETETESESEAETDVKTNITKDGIKYTLSETGDYYVVDGLAGNDTVVIIPDHVNGIPVKEIAPEAFEYEEEITEVQIPSGVEKIGYRAFGHCYKLKVVRMPEYLTEIDGDLFTDCYALEEITLPKGVEKIGSYAFYRCQSLPSINIPETVVSIGERAFFCCHNLKTIDLPDHMEFIGSQAFYGSLGGCDMVIPEGFSRIESSAFYTCGMVSAYVPDGVTEIGRHAFEDCKKLTSLSLPSSLKKIESQGFYKLEQLKTIEFRGTMSQWNQVILEEGAIWGGTVIVCTDGEIVIQD